MSKREAQFNYFQETTIYKHRHWLHLIDVVWNMLSNIVIPFLKQLDDKLARHLLWRRWVGH